VCLASNFQSRNALPMTSGGGVFNIGQLKSSVQSGRVSQARLNEMVARILAPFFHLGQDSVRKTVLTFQAKLICFLQGYPAVSFDVQKPDGTGSRNLVVNVRNTDHTALAKEIAAASSVLLKNTRVVDSTTGTTLRGLPAVRGVAKSVAIIGQDAKMPNVKCNDLNECNDGTMVIGSKIFLEFIYPPV